IVESGSEGLVVELGPHDYENMALVNINRGAFGVSHWKPYSDMANYQHDDSSSSERKPCNTSSSTDYESMHYYDVYPLSKRLQDKLVKNLAPATPESDTYEPIEVFEPGREEEPNEAREEEDDYELRVPVPITLIHHDGDKVITKRVMSMENLKDVISKHETVPMDDPQDRSDLYLLAPMRLLEPILEESEPGDLSRTSSYNNRSIMTVLSDFLNKTYASASSSAVYHPCPDGRFHESSESGGSSLVQTIEEIRNQSLYSSEPKPKIPPRMEVVPPDPHRDKKVPISTSVGSRKNILDLAGDSTSNLLNTPNKRKDDHHSNQDSSLALSPSVKYEVSSSSNGTPTPPPFSRHVSNRAPCRRKCSIIREHRYQEQSNSSTSLRPDEKYEPPPIAQRGSWNISSLQPRSYISESALSQRNIASRRSLSILDDKENEVPPSHIGRPLAPKPTGRRHISPLTNIGSLSPNSRIFSQDV
ncbi:XK-related protein, partial [Caligus rogercresseyi]